MGRGRGPYRVLVMEPEGKKDNLEDLEIEGWKIINFIPKI
jgi:hypothetical protein